MSDDDVLRERSHELIQAGKLPNRPPKRTWGGSGVGADCTICNVTVKRDELEYEIEFARDGNDDTVDTYHVHIRCFAAWQRERHNLEDVGGAGSSGDQRDRLPVSPTPAPMAGGSPSGSTERVPAS
jgi:hypothetical protein